jgi:hypothetical protein
MRVAQSLPQGANQRFSYRVPARRGGWYFLQVKVGSPSAGPYTLSYEKTPRPKPRPAAKKKT